MLPEAHNRQLLIKQTICETSEQFINSCRPAVTEELRIVRTILLSEETHGHHQGSDNFLRQNSAKALRNFDWANLLEA